MSYMRQTSMYRWTGTTSVDVEAKLPTPSLAGKNKLQAAQFADLAVGDQYSEEIWLGMKYIDSRTHTKLANARVTKLHGTLPPLHLLKGGYTATYATPKAAAAGSTIADVIVPPHLINNGFHADTPAFGPAAGSGSVDTYDATDKEYQFMVFQNDTTETTAWNPVEQIGNSAYPLIEVAYQIETKDGDNAAIPAGNDKSSMYSQSQIDVYVVVNNEMQLFGCTQNAVTAGFGLEWDNIVKGALNGIESKFLTTRVQEISGNLYSLNPYNWLNFLYGSNLGSNGTSTQIQVSSDWKPVQPVEVIIDTFSDQGRRLTIHSGEAFLKINGDINLGDGPALMPWMIDLGETANIYISDSYWDVHRFLIDIETTL